MDVPTMGVEEELMLVDPETRRVTARSHQVLKEAADHGPGQRVDGLEHELFRHQVEIRTDPESDAAELHEALLLARRSVSEAAGAVGLATIATGTVPHTADDPETTREDRYLDMVERYADVAIPAGTCGMHVHVRIDSDEQGVRAADDLAPWLPVLLAVSANSPFDHGHDTGYASWRSQVWSRWPSAGPTERFGSVAAYEDLGRRLVASGAARDPGMLYFDARLSREHPTVELRVADVCTDPEDAVLLAVLARALVMHSAREPGFRAESPWRAELLRAAQWRAARWGLADTLLHPATGDLAPAREVLTALVEHVSVELDAAGDLDRAHSGLDRVLAGGGAARQRAAYERTGGETAGVVDDLVARTTPS